jgi:hypothetical protein
MAGAADRIFCLVEPDEDQLRAARVRSTRGRQVALEVT